VVSIHGILQQNFRACVEIQNSTIHAGNIQREKSAAIRQCTVSDRATHLLAGGCP
jgi:hypothetical protein